MMSTDIKNYIVDTNNVIWKPLLEEGVDTTGISIKPLRYDEATKRAPSFIVKFEPGAKYPLHNHPGGEEVLVLEGSVFFNETELLTGDYLYTPKDFKHSVHTINGCKLLFIVPEEVEVIK